MRVSRRADVRGAYTRAVAEIELVEREATAEEYEALRGAVGWNEIGVDGLRTGLANSLYSVVLERDGVAIGCGRVVGDGGIYFYLQDVIVLPEFQGNGLGARIMDALTAYLDRAAGPGAFIGLMAADGVERFYERYGFERRPADRPGMSRIG